MAFKDDPPEVRFTAFYLAWARLMRWQVPALHLDLCAWLAANKGEPLLLLMIFRGAAKSTIVGVYFAWLLWEDAAEVCQVWGADKKVAGKMSRYVKHVLRKHPWTAGMLDPRAPDNGFFVSGATDMRNPSMEAVGVEASATGSRSTRTCFDDIEVPKNVRTAAKRASLREKVDEAIHILVPGGSRLYVGTPHTHDTIYGDVDDEGAAIFRRPLFAHDHRIPPGGADRVFSIPFAPADDGYTVFSGVGKFGRMLVAGRDYRIADQRIEFAAPPDQLIDIYTGNAWPERFTSKDLRTRRRACRTINSWDSQYMLRPVRVAESRLDPDRMPVYADEPRIEWRNRIPVMMLGDVRIAGFVAYWDVSLGKIHSDDSALCIMLTDYAGRLYWHRAIGLTGDLEVLDKSGNLVGGQVHQLIQALTACHAHHVHIEVNGPGGFVPPIATRHCKPHGISVSECYQSGNKQARILDAFEAPLSSGFLWCHQQVTESPAFEQVREFDPLLTNQVDDYIDAAAGAIHETPIRLDRITGAEQRARQVVRTLGIGNDRAEVEMVFDGG